MDIRQIPSRIWGDIYSTHFSVWSIEIPASKVGVNCWDKGTWVPGIRIVEIAPPTTYEQIQKRETEPLRPNVLVSRFFR